MSKTFTPIQLLLVVVLLIVLYFSRIVVIAAIIGVGIGVLFSPLLDHLQNRLRIKRGFCALILIAGMLALVVIILTFFGWIIIEQTNSLIEGMPELSVQLRGKLENIFDSFPWMRDQIKEFDFATTAQKAIQYIFKGARLGLLAIGGGVFALIIGIYLAIDGDYYFKGIVRAFPPKHRNRAHDLLTKCSNVTRVWFRAQLVDMGIVGFITTLGLWIVGIKYWALFGLLTAILGIIPYVGVMIVVVIVSIITLATNSSQVPWVFLVFFITQQIEGHLVLPLVMKGQAEIPEALLIVIMLFFGSWFGILGVFIAPPMVAVLICLYRELYLPAIEIE